jgi:hypothetical protein
MIWKQREGIGIKSYPQCYEPSGQMSTEQPKIHLSTWLTEQMYCCHRKFFLKSALVAHFNEENQAEERELDSNLLEKKRNITLANM